MRIKLWLVVMLGIFGCVSVQAKNCEGRDQPCQQQVPPAGHQPEARGLHNQQPEARHDMAQSNHPHQVHTKKKHNEMASHRSAQAKGMYIVKANQLNIRNEPGHHGKVHGRFHSGQTVQVFAIIDGWAKVLFNGHYQWVSAEYLQPR